MDGNEEKKFTEVKNKLKEFKDFLKNKIIDSLKDKNVEEMKKYFSNMDNDTLLVMCEKIALEEEMYEVCAAVQQVIEERKINQENTSL